MLGLPTHSVSFCSRVQDARGLLHGNLDGAGLEFVLVLLCYDCKLVLRIRGKHHALPCVCLGDVLNRYALPFGRSHRSDDLAGFVHFDASSEFQVLALGLIWW